MRGCLVGNFAGEITNATPALKKRVTELLDEATRRIAVVVSQAQETSEINPDVTTMDLSRFILNSLYGAIFRSKTDRSERPMKLLEQFALDPYCGQEKLEPSLIRPAPIQHPFPAQQATKSIVTSKINIAASPYTLAEKEIACAIL